VPLTHFAGPRMTGAITDQVRRLSWRPRDRRGGVVTPGPRWVQLSLDQLLGPQGGAAIQLFDPAAELAMEDLELRLTMVALLARLPHRWAFVLGEQLLRGRTRQDVASELGVSASRVCQINKLACEAMRDIVRSEQEGAPVTIDVNENATQRPAAEVSVTSGSHSR
jgi:DNA-directed RNA polymerase specialized sigma subunit